MEELDIVLPIILVLIAFLLKLVVDKDVKYSRCYSSEYRVTD